MAPVLVSATINVAHAILTESALSFLGFGVRPPYATWGNILADGRAYIFDAPWLFLIPGAAILVVVLAFNLVGEGLRDAPEPEVAKAGGLMANESSELLKIRNLHVDFSTEAGSVPAVSGIDLSIAAGETVALVGESGCGKSVTAMSVMRLTEGRIAAGSIHFQRPRLGQPARR
ncbi:MAG: ATP-binding cassette domain-containing protein [Pseudomonadota bacterium]